MRRDNELMQRVLNSPRLPSLPTIALEVIELVQQKDVNLKLIAQTIQHDPALSGKILRTVNASFYGQSQSIGTISGALVVLGLNSVKTLALGFSLVSNLVQHDDTGFDHMRFWRRSLFTAVAARHLAKLVNLAHQEEAFLGGLLHDQGMLALSQTIGEQYHDIVCQARDHAQLLRLEQRELGCDHAEVGGTLAEHWKLPAILIAPIRHHHHPDLAPEEVQPIVRCVALGTCVADVYINEEGDGEALKRYYRLAERWFDLAAEQCRPLLRQVHRHTVEMRRLFDLPTGGLGNADEILARANEAMLQISLQNTNELEAANKQLARKALTDSLTGAANRGRFNEYMAEQFAAAQPDAPLGLLFFDVDHFKRFNDTHGHQVGDRVLVAMAEALRHRLPPHALIARYGGEEFAVVVPCCDRADTTRLAEQTRRVIAETAVAGDDGEPLHITASIGVAVHDGCFRNADQFIKAADRAVYAAKLAGRDCVRVFTPATRRKSA
jgi:diguanylate cyclase (GGDEF)-like protein